MLLMLLTLLLNPSILWATIEISAEERQAYLDSLAAVSGNYSFLREASGREVYYDLFVSNLEADPDLGGEDPDTRRYVFQEMMAANGIVVELIAPIESNNDGNEGENNENDNENEINDNEENITEEGNNDKPGENEGENENENERENENEGENENENEGENENENEVENENENENEGDPVEEEEELISADEEFYVLSSAPVNDYDRAFVTQLYVDELKGVGLFKQDSDGYLEEEPPRSPVCVKEFQFGSFTEGNDQRMRFKAVAGTVPAKDSLCFYFVSQTNPWLKLYEGQAYIDRPIDFQNGINFYGSDWSSQVPGQWNLGAHSGWLPHLYSSTIRVGNLNMTRAYTLAHFQLKDYEIIDVFAIVFDKDADDESDGSNEPEYYAGVTSTEEITEFYVKTDEAFAIGLTGKNVECKRAFLDSLIVRGNFSFKKLTANTMRLHRAYGYKFNFTISNTIETRSILFLDDPLAVVAFDQTGTSLPTALSSTSSLVSQGKMSYIDPKTSKIASDYGDALICMYESLTVSSDVRLKTDIRLDTHSYLNQILRIQPARFFLKGQLSGQKIGVIAQDVESVLPELISYSRGKKTVNTSLLGYQTLMSIQEWEECYSEKITSLEARMDELSHLIEAL